MYPLSLIVFYPRRILATRSHSWCLGTYRDPRGYLTWAASICPGLNHRGSLDVTIDGWLTWFCIYRGCLCIYTRVCVCICTYIYTLSCYAYMCSQLVITSWIPSAQLCTFSTAKYCAPISTGPTEEDLSIHSTLDVACIPASWDPLLRSVWYAVGVWRYASGERLISVQSGSYQCKRICKRIRDLDTNMAVDMRNKSVYIRAFWPQEDQSINMS